MKTIVISLFGYLVLGPIAMLTYLAGRFCQWLSNTKKVLAREHEFVKATLDSGGQWTASEICDYARSLGINICEENIISHVRNAGKKVPGGKKIGRCTMPAYEAA